MNKRILPTILFSTALGLSLSLILSGCGQENKPINNAVVATAQAELHNVSQQDINNIAANLDVNYRVVTNIPSDKCDAKISDGACFEVELIFTAKQAINAKGWSIYFSHISPVQSSIGDELLVEHLNGDLHRVGLKNNFTGFKAGEKKRVAFRAKFWMLSETDALPNYIVTAAE